MERLAPPRSTDPVLVLQRAAPFATGRTDCPFCSRQYPFLRRASNRAVPWDLHSVSNGVKIDKQGEDAETKEGRAAIQSCHVRLQKASHDTHLILNRHLAKLLETKDFPLVGAPGLEPGTR